MARSRRRRRWDRHLGPAPLIRAAAATSDASAARAGRTLGTRFTPSYPTSGAAQHPAAAARAAAGCSRSSRAKYACTMSVASARARVRLRLRARVLQRPLCWRQLPGADGACGHAADAATRARVRRAPRVHGGAATARCGRRLAAVDAARVTSPPPPTPQELVDKRLMHCTRTWNDAYGTTDFLDKNGQARACPRAQDAHVARGRGRSSSAPLALRATGVATASCATQQFLRTLESEYEQTVVQLGTSAAGAHAVAASRAARVQRAPPAPRDVSRSVGRSVDPDVQTWRWRRPAW